MTLSERIAKIQQLAYTNRFHIDEKWGQEGNWQGIAHDTASAIIDLCTGGTGAVDPEPLTPIPEPVVPVPEPVVGDTDTGSRVPDSNRRDPNYQPPKWKYPRSEHPVFPLVGRFFTLDEFAQYLQSTDMNHMRWSPSGITVHHTAAPNLSQRKKGFEDKHMQYLRDYYKNKLRWSSGPHLFVDDNGIWVFTPLTDRGVHARSFNSSRYGIEMLGDFDYKDDPTKGRGQKVMDNTKAACAMLMKYRGISRNKLNFHNMDPLTSKTCPGLKVKFKPFEKDVHAILDAL